MKYLNLYNTMSGYTEASPTFSRPHVSYIEDEDLVIYDDLQPEPEKDWSKEYLTFLALEDGTFSRNGGFMYRIGDGTTWGEWTLANEETSDVTTTIGTTPLIHAGEKVQFYRGGGGGEKFTSTGRFEAMGNINSIVWGTNLDNLDLFNDAHTLQKTFSNCTGLTTAENLVLPATGLTESCYMSMFEGCTNLVKAPKVLPAMTLANYCYTAMFMGCTSLTTAPELPATTLAQNCYSSMFYGCTSLTTAPELPATTLAQACYTRMFPGCTSLTTAPELPATTLASGCYQSMFQGCTSLNYIKMLATDVSARRCLDGWVSGVTLSGTFVKHPDATLPSGTSGIPAGWTVQTATN